MRKKQIIPSHVVLEVITRKVVLDEGKQRIGVIGKNTYYGQQLEKILYYAPTVFDKVCPKEFNDLKIAFGCQRTTIGELKRALDQLNGKKRTFSGIMEIATKKTTDYKLVEESKTRFIVKTSTNREDVLSKKNYKIVSDLKMDDTLLTIENGKIYFRGRGIATIGKEKELIDVLNRFVAFFERIYNIEKSFKS